MKKLKTLQDRASKEIDHLRYRENRKYKELSEYRKDVREIEGELNQIQRTLSRWYCYYGQLKLCQDLGEMPKIYHPEYKEQ